MKILIPIAIIIFGFMIGIIPTFAEEISDATTNLFNYDIQDGELAIMWLGNHQKGSLEGYASAGFLLRTSNYAIAIDPSSLLLDDIDSLDRLDAIFITHDHGDHFDPDTVIAMQTKTDSFVIADPTSASMLIDKIPEDKLIRIEPNQQITISEIIVDAFAAEHPTETPLVYVIEFDGFRIFHGSDSGFVEGLKNIESRVHVAIVPVGDPSPTASPHVALEMTRATNPYIVIPMHGSPQQIQEFSNLVEASDLQTTVTIPSPLEIIIPYEVIPEFGLLSVVVLSSGIGMMIYLLRNKNFTSISYLN
ncbi:MAG: MBL fold metallo-hydrolase [Nitrosopumilus sp.]|nr:MBL fold metallo-hydrolase [Nitrososphaerota archaeon]